MEIMIINVQDGRKPIEVCVSESNYGDEAARLRMYLKAAEKSFADADEHYQRGYDDAVKFIAEGEVA